MTTARRIFAPEERLSILQEGEREGQFPLRYGNIKLHHHFMPDGNTNILRKAFTD